MAPMTSRTARVAPTPIPAYAPLERPEADVAATAVLLSLDVDAGADAGLDCEDDAELLLGSDETEASEIKLLGPESVDARD